MKTNQSPNRSPGPNGPGATVRGCCYALCFRVLKITNTNHHQSMHCQPRTKHFRLWKLRRNPLESSRCWTMRVRKGHQISVTLRHPGRNRLAAMLIVLSVVGVLTSLTLVAAGALLHFAVAPYAAILDTYDGVYLPVILFALGVAGMAVDSLLMFLLMDFGKEERADHFGKVCLAILSCAVLTIVAGVICFVHIREVKSSFQAGIVNGMKNYKVHPWRFSHAKIQLVFVRFYQKRSRKSHWAYVDLFVRVSS